MIRLPAIREQPLALRREMQEPAYVDFLPAADALLAKPLSPIHFRLILAICLLLLSLLTIAWFAHVDIYAVANARIQPTGRSKVIQSLERGRVMSVGVENGSRVKQGDVLVELDPTEFLADRVSDESELRALRAEVVRRRAALTAASHRDVSYLSRVGMESDPNDVDATRERAVLVADLMKLKAQIEAARAKAAETMTRRDAAANSVSAQDTLVAALQKRVTMYQSMVEKKLGSAAALIDAEQELGEQSTVLANLKGQVTAATAAVESLKREQDFVWSTFVADNTQMLSNREVRIDTLQQSLVKSSARVGYNKLLAPIDGVVQQLAVTTIGQVVSPAERLLMVVPENAALEAEALVPNSDIGFVEAGQTAILKIDAFPFIRYGTITARIARVSGESVDANDAARLMQEQGGGQAPGNSGQFVYPVTLALDSAVIQIDGRPVRLLPGMTATAEIKTGRRRLIEYLLAPLFEIVSGAAHER